MIRPVELGEDLPIWFDGNLTRTAEVWETLVASAEGRLERVRELVAGTPVLACCKYNYLPPLHLAARQGHLELVRFLIDQGGLFPKYGSDPFGDGFAAIARNRGHHEIAALLEEVERHPDRAAPCVAPTDAMRIELPGEAARTRFRQLLDARLRGEAGLAAIEAALAADPVQATDPFQYWGEGVLAVPAQHGDFELVGLLMRFGAKVPEVSKWCARYYFKRDDMGAFLLESGMNPNHMSWQRVTLLHELAFRGEAGKVRLLLKRGADPNPVDEEYGITPLALAVRRGQDETARVLRGAGSRE